MKLALFCVLLSSTLLLTSSRHRFVREAEAGDTIAEGEAAEAVKSVETLDQAETDVDVEEPAVSEKDAEEPEPEPVTEAAVDQEEEEISIKEQNKPRCQKCLKPAYKVNHEDFCHKCVYLKLVDPEEAEMLANAIQCKKCSKPRYRLRHGDYCESHCTENKEEMEEVETIVEKNVEDETVEVEEAEQNLVEDVEVEEEEEVKHVPRRKANKKHKKKDKKNRRKEVHFATSDMTEDKSVETSQPAQPQMSLLGAILKALVVQNTWVDE